MVESLQNSGYFKAVTADHSNFSADYQLQGDIKIFQADYTNSTPPVITIKVHMTLMNLQTLKVVKTFVIEQESTAKANNIEAIHQGFNEAFALAQKEAMKNIIKAMR